MNKKEVQRTEYIRIRMTKAEKKQFEDYAKRTGLATSKLARNKLLELANCKGLTK